MAESLGHDPNTLSGTHCLAGRPGNRTGCALLAEGGGIEPLTLRSPWFSGPVASHLAAPSLWYPCADSNREPPRSKRGTSTRLGYRGELVLAKRFERSTGQALDLLPLPVGTRELVRLLGSNRD